MGVVCQRIIIQSLVYCTYMSLFTLKKFILLMLFELFICLKTYLHIEEGHLLSLDILCLRNMLSEDSLDIKG